MVATFVPWSPLMPLDGLDPSWMLGLNQAVAQGIPFGKGILFTYGPALAVLLGDYHPATYGLAVSMCLVLAIAYWHLLSRIFWRRPVWALVIALVLMGVESRESLLYLAGPLAVMAVIQRLDESRPRPWGSLLIDLAIATLPFGILLAVKGTFYPIALTAVGVLVVVLGCNRQRGAAGAALVTPVAAFVAVWLLYRQPISGIPAYFVGVTRVATAYTDAMAGGGGNTNVAAAICAIAAGLIVLVIVARRGWSVQRRVALSAVFAITLFTCLKEGYVRADGSHVFIAVATILCLGVILVADLELLGRGVVATSFALAVVATTLAFQGHLLDVTNGVAATVSRTLGQSRSLEDTYRARLEGIALARPIPRLDGTVDIYSYDQAQVVASGNSWSPRPMLQSYSVYSPWLAELNRQHLVGPDGPDWVLFAPQAIDGRYPTIEDGPSWLELLARYRPVRVLDGHVLLKRTDGPALSLIGSSVHLTAALGERIEVDSTAPLTFLTIDESPSFLGQAALTLWKSSPLELRVWLEDGTTQSYRLPVGMAQAGFVVSPFASDPGQFAALWKDSQLPASAAPSKVVAFVVESRQPVMWQSSFGVTMTQVQAPSGGTG